ncbi:MAG: M56 family metallopeptidase [Saprospiraceae bacterium]|nr:M56 family metallopeptidase [Saprospiraceae bacterium]
MLPLFLTDFSHNLTDTLGMVFLHSLWQFTLIWAVLSLILKKNLVRSSPVRYAIAFVSVFFLVITAVVTFICYFEFENYQDIIYPDQTIFTINHMIPQKKSFFDSWTLWFLPYQDWVITLWIAGALLLSGKMIFSLWYIQYVKKSAFIPEGDHLIVKSWQNLIQKLDISKKIKIGFSHHIHTPLIVGQIKPMILFPFSVVNQLSEQEVEFILLHELAHYARSDYWANLLQSFVEILFYYHPAVYIISQYVREERENCCDEFALQTIGGKPVDYARTLIKLQEFDAGKSPEFSLAFTGKNKIFIDRIKKILNMNQQKNVKNEHVFLSMLVVLALFFATRETIANNFFPDKVTDYFSLVFPDGFTKPSVQSDTLPKTKESITIIQKDDEKEVKVQMENGEIRKLEIDGKEIPAEEYNKYSDITQKMKIRNRPEGMDGSPQIFMFDLNDDGLRWHGDMDIKWDSLFGGLSWEKLEKLQFDEKEIHDNMEKMEERIRKLNFRFMSPDSMMSFRSPEKNIRIYRYPNGDEEEFQQNFEFSFPDQPGLRKDLEFEIERGFGREKNINEILGNQLNADGLLIPGKENKVELSGKNLKINGEKQPSNIWNKYKRIFEEETGNVMEKKSRISFHYYGKEAKRRYRAL